MFFHFGSDCQKYYVLKYKVPRSLITDGFFAYTRNPNYFGEILIYTGYAVWSRSLMVFGIFLVQWAMVFLPNMLDKDKSMSIQARVTLYIGFTHAGVNVVFLISFCSTPPSM